MATIFPTNPTTILHNSTSSSKRHISDKIDLKEINTLNGKLVHFTDRIFEGNSGFAWNWDLDDLLSPRSSSGYGFFKNEIKPTKVQAKTRNTRRSVSRLCDHLYARQAKILLKRYTDKRLPFPVVSVAGIKKTIVLQTNIDARVKLFICGECSSQHLIISKHPADAISCSKCGHVDEDQVYLSDKSNSTRLQPTNNINEGDKHYTLFKDTRGYKFNVDKLQVQSFIATSIHTTIFKDTGYIAVRQNGKAVNCHKIILDNPINNEFKDIIEDVFKKLGITHPLPCSFKSIYKFSRNKMWQDIGSFSILGMDDKFVRRLSYHHKKYGTKKARQMFYETNSKQLIKFLSTPFIEKYTRLQLVAKVLARSGYDDARILNALTAYKTNYLDARLATPFAAQFYYNGSVESYYELKVFIEVLETALGSKQKVINYIGKCNAGVNTMVDTGRQLQAILEVKPDYVLPPISYDLVAVERLISRDYRSIVLRANKVLPQMKDVEDKTTLAYVIKQCKESEELTAIGQDLNICVGSYSNMVIQGNTHIFYMAEAETNKYIACIQVDPKQKTIVQAKLARNAKLRTSPDHNEILQIWAEENKLKVNTVDVADLDPMVSASLRAVQMMMDADNARAPAIIQNIEVPF